MHPSFGYLDGTLTSPHPAPRRRCRMNRQPRATRTSPATCLPGSAGSIEPVHQFVLLQRELLRLAIRVLSDVDALPEEDLAMLAAEPAETELCELAGTTSPVARGLTLTATTVTSSSLSVRKSSAGRRSKCLGVAV